jgi:putative PEP-CTERM system integral membrane protein
MWEDQAAAKQAYLHLMDAPFEKAERESILNAVQATWDSDEAKAGLVNIGQKIVHLESQRVELKVQGPLVFGQLDEVYRNTTDSDQEILIYFTLPESAALTALYLSEDPNDPEQFPYVLAPRGAAQEVYNNQVRRFRDPALLEQVGPRQYRLRAYPVLADFRDKPMYLRMRWTALADAQGLPLPFATEVRNLYWNSRTDREFLCIQDEEYACDDGRAIADPRPMDVEVAGWLPARLGRPVPPQTLVASLPGGQKLVARADSGEDGSCEGEKVAVVVDGSFSMGANLEQLQKEFTWMREGLSRCTTRLVVAPGWGGARVKEDTLAWDPASYTFFGNLRPQEALEGLRDQAFDRVLFLTDAGSYDDPADTAVPDFTGQLWLIHLGGALPQAYPDVIGDRLLSGGIAMSVKEAVARWGAEEVADGYRWQLEESTAGDTPGFLALAGRRALTIQARENLPDTLEEFDAVHKVALSAGAVTPWSSMLVLVDDEQRRQLKEAEEKADRFNRESEGGAELMTQPGNPLVSAVPEPATWMLLGCAGAGILGLRKRAAKTQRAQRGESRGERGLPEKVAREAGEL